VLLLHVEVAFAAEHTLPHAPQFETVELVLVSQPLVGSPSQSPYVPVHAGWQMPPEQLVVPCEFVQTVPHAPQLAELVSVLVSQPLTRLPSQSP
jgi:hypothetical protein